MMEQCERNRRILAYLNKHGRLKSYQLIADHFGVARNVVAGVAFRAKHPPKKRKQLGRVFKSYMPLMTAQNYR